MRKTIFSIDDYRITKEVNQQADVNYNTYITIFKKDQLISGWHEKETVKDIEILEFAVKSIKRYEKQKNQTLEQFLCGTS